jgi:hypothetical protein
MTNVPDRDGNEVKINDVHPSDSSFSSDDRGEGRQDFVYSSLGYSSPAASPSLRVTEPPSSKHVDFLPPKAYPVDKKSNGRDEKWCRCRGQYLPESVFRREACAQCYNFVYNSPKIFVPGMKWRVTPVGQVYRVDVDGSGGDMSYDKFDPAWTEHELTVSLLSNGTHSVSHCIPVHKSQTLSLTAIWKGPCGNILYE